MKTLSQNSGGFTLLEALVASVIMSLVLAAVTAGVMSLQRSFSASQDFIISHLEQVRAMDTLQRDARSATSAEIRAGGTCVVLTIPTGDPGLLDLQLPATLRSLFTTSGGGAPVPATKTVAYSFCNQRLTRTESNQVQTVATRQTKCNFQQNGSQISATVAFPSRYSGQATEVPASTLSARLNARTSSW